MTIWSTSSNKINTTRLRTKHINAAFTLVSKEDIIIMSIRVANEGYQICAVKGWDPSIACWLFIFHAHTFITGQLFIAILERYRAVAHLIATLHWYWNVTHLMCVFKKFSLWEHSTYKWKNPSPKLLSTCCSRVLAKNYQAHAVAEFWPVHTPTNSSSSSSISLDGTEPGQNCMPHLQCNNIHIPYATL